jgi:zinc protease
MCRKTTRHTPDNDQVLTSIRPTPGQARPYHFPPFERGELPNGAALIVCPVPKLPLATLVAVTDAGSARDPNGREGTAGLTAKLLVEGTRRRTGAQLAEKLECIGTSLDSGADWDSALARVTFLSEHLDAVTDLLGEVLLEPTFPERELQRLKSERVADLLQIESEPRGLADEAFESFLYTSDSRFSIPSAGSKTSVPAVSLDNVTEFHAATHYPRNTTFIVVGDVDFAHVYRRLENALANWTSGDSATEVRPNEFAAHERRVKLVSKADAPQSEIRVGHAGLPRKHSDYFPVVVMNAIFGGLFGSRINLNLREAHGYTYGASSYFDWRRDAGPFVISTAVANEVTGATLKEILFEIDKMREERVSDAELSLAKDYLEGVFPIRYETTAAVAAALSNLTVHGLEEDYFDSYRAKIRAVTTADVLAAAQQHIHPDKLQTLVVGNVAEVRGHLDGLPLGRSELASG